jgi:hypothetical protein
MRFRHEQPQNQTSLNFSDSFIEDQQVYELLERQKAADQYHVVDPLLIEKRGDIWYMKNKNMTAEEWDRLYTDPDNYLNK